MATHTARKYDSTRRQESARHTRLKIAQAARSLFEQRGYAGATIEMIAREAGVAKETVYATFKNKKSILGFLLEISIGGDDQPVPLLQRAEIEANLRETNQHRQVAVFAEHVTRIMARAAPVFEITRVAAKTEPEIAGRVKRLYRERLRNIGRFAEALAARGALRSGMDQQRAAEIVWGLSSAELYLLMTEYAGWTREQYAAWLADTLERTILP